MRRLLQPWTTAEILVVATMGIAIGLIWVPWTWFYQATAAVLGPWAAHFVGGFWLIGGVITPYIVRKPGSALLGELIAALAEMPLTPWGAIVLLAGLIEGGACEVFFLATGYRRFSLPWLMGAAAFGGLAFSLLYLYRIQGWGRLAIEAQVLYTLMRMLGAAILAGGGAKLIADALVPTGVLDAFPIARERRPEI